MLRDYFLERRTRFLYWLILEQFAANCVNKWERPVTFLVIEERKALPCFRGVSARCEAWAPAPLVYRRPKVYRICVDVLSALVFECVKMLRDC